MSDAAIRSRAIQLSLRAFFFGVLGLIPILGFPAAICALVCWIKVSSRVRGIWNPGSIYLHLGAVFGFIGILLTLLISIGLLVAGYNTLIVSPDA